MGLDLNDGGTRSILAIRRQRGRIWLWTALILAGSGSLAGYWYSHPRSAPEWINKRLPAAPDVRRSLYKWQDDQGGWHFTDTPPPGRSYETLSYPKEANVIPSAGPREQPQPLSRQDRRTEK